MRSLLFKGKNSSQSNTHQIDHCSLCKATSTDFNGHLLVHLDKNGKNFGELNSGQVREKNLIWKVNAVGGYWKVGGASFRVKLLRE